MNGQKRTGLVKNAEKGAAALSDAELLAILIASGSKNESLWNWPEESWLPVTTISMSWRNSISDLCKNFRASVGQSHHHHGSLEIGKRRKASDVIKRKKITASVDLFNCLNLIC